MHSSPFPSTGHCATALLDLVHSDLCGPLPVQTLEGYHYWITFIDNHTRYHIVVMLKNKRDALRAFKAFKAVAENQLRRTIKALHNDMLQDAD